MSSHLNTCKCNNTFVVAAVSSIEKIEGFDFEKFVVKGYERKGVRDRRW